MAALNKWLVGLAALGPSLVVITGIPTANKQLVNLGYDHRSKRFCKVVNDQIPAKFPGTGDIFASVLIGALLQGSSLDVAMQESGCFRDAGG